MIQEVIRNEGGSICCQNAMNVAAIREGAGFYRFEKFMRIFWRRMRCFAARMCCVCFGNEGQCGNNRFSRCSFLEKRLLPFGGCWF